jgi:long-subunit fatty acid transport protein
MRKLFINRVRGAGLALATLFVQQVSANGLQFWNVATFQNPASMQETQGRHLVSGILVPDFYEKFHGTVLGTEGTVKSNNILTLPYITFSDRLNCTFVGGLDYSNPTLAYVLWPVSGFQAPVAVDAIIQTNEITPKLSIAINDKFAIGFSFRYLNIWRAELNYDVFGNFLTNRGKGNGFGAAAGFWWMINPRTFLDVCYFSPIRVTTHGDSVSGVFFKTNTKSRPFNVLPMTFVLNLAHVFTSKFSGSIKLAYSHWHPDKQLVLDNTAIGMDPLILTLNWRDTFMGMASGRYLVHPKAAFLAIVGYDMSPSNPRNNILIFPVENLPFGGFGGEYMFAPNSWLKVFAALAQGNSPKIHNKAQFTEGKATVRVAWLDVSATVNF